MALFKIEKGLAENLTKNRPNTVEGYCYVTIDDGKFYIDTATDTGTANRIVLNAGKADRLSTARKIELTGDASGSVNFDGSKDVKISVDISRLDSLGEDISALPNAADDGIKIEENTIKHINSVTAGTVNEGGAARTLGFGGSFNIPSITYDAQGHITDKGSVTLKLPANPNTDTKVTSVGNHYAPAADTNAALNVDAANATASATWGSTNLVTGVNLQRDAKGHVVGVTVDSIKMPANPNTDTKNTAGSTDSSSKLFLIGATSQTASSQTYSHDTAYVGTDGCLYSNGTKVSVAGHTHNYLPLSGGTMTGRIDIQYAGARVRMTNGTNIMWVGLNGAGDKWGIYDETNSKYLVSSDGTNVVLNGNALTATNVAWSGVTNKPSYYDGKAITSITRSGNTFTMTYLDGTTSTFTQKDNDTGVTSVEVTGTGGAVNAASYDSSSRKLTLTKGYTYTLPAASTTALGGIKVSSVNTTAVTVNSESTTAGRYYPVELNSDHKAIVNVPWVNTTYSANNGISLSGTTFSNSGVRSVATGTANGTISVNTGGTTANVSVKGLGTAAYQNVAAFDAAGAADTALETAKSYTDTKVAALVDSAPETLDTLNKLAAALGDDANFATTVATEIGKKADSSITITAGNGLTGGGTLAANRTINVGAGTGISVTANAVSLATVTGLTAGTYGPSENVTGNNNTTINVPEIVVDAYGRVTSVTNRVYTSKNTTYTVQTGTVKSATTMFSASVSGEKLILTAGSTSDVTVVTSVS